MKSNLRNLIALLLVLFALPSVAQTSEIEFTEYKLDNGLHVILQPDNTTPNVIVSIMYHVGSKNELPHRTGFAHFFEHLMFEGTENIPRGMFSRHVEEAGGTLNAFTSNDVTYYYVMLPSNQLELGLWLESERLMHARVDSIGIATQKGVVTEEMKQTRDNRPYGRLMIETVSRAFREHSYRWDVLGADEHIRNAEDHEFREFHDMFYVPNNAVLVISGDIDVQETKLLVEKYFAEIPAGKMEIRRPLPNEPRRTEELRDTVYDNIQLPAVIQAYHIPGRGTEDYYAVEMLGTLLTQGQSSRLYRTLVDEQRLALQVMAVPMGLEHPGLTLIFAIPQVGVDPKVLEDALNKELEKAQTELISELELEKLKNQFENRIVNSNTTIANRAQNLAMSHTYFNDASLVNSTLEKYLSVTREDILNAAKEYLREDNRVVLYFMPKSQMN
ncbi:MAG TPA: insulinase family protein [Mariniphaga anaerophila]|uniref:Insulinase family protein n=1 Tax=Mariniphaga anaerophila TaxID=1484053 RepID=A0A831LDJ0_9BACT|nr:insulinase family protein [Mariniphaga anaerophila]